MKFLRISAVAILAMRSAVRSRFVLSLAGLLVLTVGGLPFVLKGDGTLEGQVRVLLRYTLGLASLILMTATLWASCSTVSREVEDKSIRLIAVKPVPRYEIWLGKWLGLLALNGLLLSCCGLATYGLTRWTFVTSDASARERSRVAGAMLVGRRCLLPRTESLDTEVLQRYQRLVAQGASPDDHERHETLQEIRQAVLGERLTVRVGETRTWWFDLPADGKADRIVTLRFRLSTMAWNRLPITGDWILSSPSGQELCRVTSADCFGGTHQLRLPASFWAPARDSGETRSADATVGVQFHNALSGVSHTALFDATGPAELLVHETGFLSNLVRTLLVILCQTALVAAVGLTMGSVFSAPVAVFAACSLVVMVWASQYFAMASSPGFEVEEHHHHGEPAAPGFVIKVGEYMAEGLNVIAAPVMRFDPIKRLADGILIPLPRVAAAAGMLLFAYPAVLMACSGYVLNRRELANVRSV